MSYLLIKTTLHQVRQAEDGIRDTFSSRGLGDVYKSQGGMNTKIEAAKICNLAGCNMILSLIHI